MTGQPLRLPAPDVILTAGLHWMFETGQPDDAHAQHHGEPLTADNNRTYHFVPWGAQGLPTVVIAVAHPEWVTRRTPHGEEMAPSNPLEPGELDAFAAELEHRGFTVRSTWNGHPGHTGSVGLVRPAHPAQVAAVDRYRAGCRDHPTRSVFCDCEAWRAGFRRVVRPTVPSQHATADPQ